MVTVVAVATYAVALEARGERRGLAMVFLATPVMRTVDRIPFPATRLATRAIRLAFAKLSISTIVLEQIGLVRGETMK
jgi:hypothetical protein